MLQSSAIEEALKFIASHPEIALKFLNAELEMPNIPTPTMGGHRFRTTLAEFNGYSLQQNQLTHHARILNANDVRIAWGTLNGMEKALDRLILFAQKYA